MDVIERINTRRSSRSFTDKEVDQDTIHQLITLGTKAATGSYGQPWAFIVIKDKSEMHSLSQEIKKYLLENIEDFPYFKQYENWLKNEKFDVFYGAPCVIAIYGKTSSHWCTYDCSLAAGNIMLAAKEFGLGTCWIGFAECIFNTWKFKIKHNVPDYYKLVSTLIVGYPDEKPQKPPKRKPATIFYEK
ncbi:nitroreductase [Clostridium luticellarii]|jgi:nitroreductase|uniref:FMN reductase n=1 Tax=Clostridium luticellarii TaxID=1691940 RepID=A0A2T0BSM2_9CLOT|nr:nitroreductase [Clostridium luticellarii]MCI1945769.1 nitroreductase [Clostridium luticellarii]MCI1968479.1 nitroreductase [Clostridium luticellarii]MCI1996007.1 nitroreductase [Clostridium luticellarii]MCI2039873.1 nitroreductase [Clostridium luticellarii]PRR86870.1 FMN reductase [Clostridium luticellarii]